MLSTPFVLEIGLLIAIVAVMIMISVLRPHRADVTPHSKEKWVIPPTFFRYAFWFGALVSLMMGVLIVYQIYYQPILNG